MLTSLHRTCRFAGMLLCSALLAATPNFAQQVVRSAQPPQSIVSLAPSPRPQGALLGRHPGDATFEHAPANYHVFAAASVGTDAGVEVLTLNFAAETKLTRIASRNNDFIVESGGTCIAGDSYAKGGSCTLLVRFNPQGPGHRLGFLTVADTTDATPMNVGLTGNGYAPAVSFTPSTITSVPGTVSSGTGTISGASRLAVDGGDNVYIADTGNNAFKEIDSTGAITSNNSDFGHPLAIAVDSFGYIYNINASNSYYFIYVTPFGSQTAYATTYVPGSCTPGAPCSLTAVGMGSPANLSIDAYNNLFFEEKTDGAAEMPVGGVAASNQFFPPLSLWYLSDGFAYDTVSSSFSADSYGNLYTSLAATTCYLIEEPLYNAEYSPTANRVAGGAACGYSGDGGQARGAEISSTIGQMAFDAAGDLYFADSGNQRVRRIDSSTGIITTIAGKGVAGAAGDTGPATNATLSSPTGVAVDSQGQVYILSNAPSAGPTQAVRKVGVTGRITFGNLVKGTTSAASTILVTNTGNENLTLSSPPTFTGANPGDFAIDPNTSTCVLTSGAVLQSGTSCKIGTVFTPAAVGSRSANLVLHDNTIAGTNTVQVTGTGILAPATMSISPPATTTSLTAGTAFTFAASVTSKATTKPTGTVTFKLNGTTIGSPVKLSTSGTASTSVTVPGSGSTNLSAVYNGDANYAKLTVSETVIVAAAKSPVTVALIPAANPANACGALSFSVQVSSPSGTTPTGTVDLMADSSLLGSAALRSGAALLAAKSPATGTHSYFASYGGDVSHPSAISPPVWITSPAIGGPCGGILPTGSGTGR